MDSAYNYSNFTEKLTQNNERNSLNASRTSSIKLRDDLRDSTTEEIDETQWFIIYQINY